MCFRIINSDPVYRFFFLLELTDKFLTSFEGSRCFSIHFVRINTSSRMFNGVSFQAILIALYFCHPRYSSFPAFPSPLDLTHSSCSKSAADSEALIPTQAALLLPATALQRGTRLSWWRGDSSPHLGLKAGSPLC